MTKLPETIDVLTFNPKTSKKLLNILKEYFECLPYMLYALDDSFYILPNTRTIARILTNIYEYFEVQLDIDIFRDAIYEYNVTSHIYDISKNTYCSNILPRYIRVTALNTAKLETFLED